MAQKLLIVILLLALIVLSAGIYWYLKFNSQPLSSFVNPSLPVATSPSDNNQTPTNSSPTSSEPVKVAPTEEQISKQVEIVLEKIKVEAASRRLTTSELMYLSNPRQAAIEDLTK
jgi:hypothetical protein